MKLRIFKYTKYDIVLISTIAVLALLLYFLFGYVFSLESASSVQITVDGELYGEYKFSQITDEKIIDVNTEFGRNTVIIDKGGAYVSYADCPDKVDVYSGRITNPGQIIICVPNRLSVQILGDKSDVDVVAY